MNKRIFCILLLTLLVSACGSKPAWDTEQAPAASQSQRLAEENVMVSWSLSDAASLDANLRKRIRLEVKKADGNPVEGFRLNHEKLLHLIVISRDLSTFSHIHPEHKGNGVFEIENSFPAGGDYRVIADFIPENGDPMAKMEWIQVEGKQVETQQVVPDEELAQVIDGKRVALAMEGLTARNPVKLTFTLTDENTNQELADLEPYLGAIGHVVILSEDGERYVHVHAEEGQGTGPDAVFEATFPRSGVYKIWGQFQRNKQVFTAGFVVKVP
ncbi:hypothetical protein [Paenibacillus puerhi]|uniref:hypothetical protein n=1 Tax=Paenibacillus puerhi TaxID=2692622 RepID=UPI00135C4C69|nr:hypothetical protein [Paenibacillus puerhi]